MFTTERKLPLHPASVHLCCACQEVVEELRPGLELRVALMSRQHCHTASHTALMVWQAARPLAQLLLRCPAFFQCKASAVWRYTYLLSSIKLSATYMTC